MDHNRRGLALMMCAFIISVLVLSIRSCSEGQVAKHSQLDVANEALTRDCYTITKPLQDYKISSIENGVMTVEAGPSLGPADLKELATRLTNALHDADHVALGSDMVFVELHRGDKTVCQAQTSSRGVWVKLR